MATGQKKNTAKCRNTDSSSATGLTSLNKSPCKTTASLIITVPSIPDVRTSGRCRTQPPHLVHDSSDSNLIHFFWTRFLNFWVLFNLHGDWWVMQKTATFTLCTVQQILGKKQAAHEYEWGLGDNLSKDPVQVGLRPFISEGSPRFNWTNLMLVFFYPGNLQLAHFRSTWWTNKFPRFFSEQKSS